MSFLQWTFLLGTFAVAGPIVAHLLAKPRFKRVPFTMLRFLRSGQSVSEGRRRLRDWIVLLLRCAMITLLAVLFAQPIMKTTREAGKPKTVHVLGLDNSMSMAYRDGSQRYFDRLVDEAIGYVRSAGDDAVFYVHGLASTASSEELTKNQTLAAIRDLDVVARRAQIGEFLSAGAALTQAPSAGPDVRVLLVSDFTRETLEQLDQVREPVAITALDVRTVRPKEPIDNVSIVAARAPEIVDQRLGLELTVANFGPRRRRCDVVAELPGLRPVMKSVDVPAGGRAACRVELDLRPADSDVEFLPVEVRVAGDDSLAQDDRRRLAVAVPSLRSTNVLIVCDGDERSTLFVTAVQTLSLRSTAERFRIRKKAPSMLQPTDLGWADTAVFSTIPGQLRPLANDLKTFLDEGGKAIFYLSDDLDSTAANHLWREGLLAALPGRWVAGRVYPQAGANETASTVDAEAARALANYRLDQIALRGHFECRRHSAARCTWSLQNDAGLVYLLSIGSGASILVNTSIDDSLGLLAKSRAAVAFCRYLLGAERQIQEYCFDSDQRVVMELAGWEIPSAARRGLWTENCDGSRSKAIVRGSTIVGPVPSGIGWVKTMGELRLCAAVNLPPGETDMTAPTPDDVDRAARRAFAVKPPTALAGAATTTGSEDHPIWPWVAWVVLALMLIEPAVANRMKR